MFEIPETNIDTAGQDTHGLCIAIVSGFPLWKRRVREDLRPFVPTREYTDPSQLPFFKKRGWVSASFIGFPNGGLNGMELAEAGSSNLLIAGVAASLFVVISLLAGQVTSVQATWARIGVRVTGSWIAASGLFRLGWAVRGG